MKRPTKDGPGEGHMRTVIVILCLVLAFGGGYFWGINPQQLVPVTKQVHLVGNKMNFAVPRHREELGSLMQVLGYTTGVELGVQRGHFAHRVLDTWPSCKQYHLVDVWAHQPNYKDLANVDQSQQDQLFEETKKTLGRFAAKCVYHRNFTSVAVHEIQSQVDYVYVDARHDYCGVMEDLQLYWPKVRSGGVMAGHDYLDTVTVRELSAQDWDVCMNGTVAKGGVKRAVDEFFAELNLPVYTTYADSPWVSWMVFKP